LRLDCLSRGTVKSMIPEVPADSADSTPLVGLASLREFLLGAVTLGCVRLHSCARMMRATCLWAR
jgi:hypothetical protein